MERTGPGAAKCGVIAEPGSHPHRARRPARACRFRRFIPVIKAVSPGSSPHSRETTSRGRSRERASGRTSVRTSIPQCPTNFDDSYSFVVYALPAATATVPTQQMGISTVRLMDDRFKAAAFAVVEYGVLSSATRASPRRHASRRCRARRVSCQGCLPTVASPARSGGRREIWLDSSEIEIADLQARQGGVSFLGPLRGGAHRSASKERSAEARSQPRVP